MLFLSPLVELSFSIKLSKIYLVTKIDREHRIVEIQRDIGTNGEFYIGVNSRFRFQNALCFLTNKGEYVIDRNNKKYFAFPMINVLWQRER